MIILILIGCLLLYFCIYGIFAIVAILGVSAQAIANKIKSKKEKKNE